MRTICPICKAMMLPAGREYEVYECQKCGHEVEVEIDVDYQKAWRKLEEWINGCSEGNYFYIEDIKEKMAATLKEQS